jgi:glycosyltransferase involved in cell wall biosynthesis
VAALHVASAISHHQAQIIHTHSFAAGLVGALATPLALSARMVATIHNYPPNATGMRATRRQHGWAVRQVLRRASRIITVSEALRRDALDLYPGAADKTVTIPNGICIPTKEERRPADSRAPFGIPADRTAVGMVARLAPQKGILEFIRACAHVAERWPDVEFVLAGDGPLRDAAESLRGELGLGEKLHLLGEIESAADLIAGLDVVVVASITEGSSLVAMEAMAAEKPVVATRVGGVPEVVADRETGLLVEPGDAGALAAAIESLLEKPDWGRDMGERGRRRAAERFDIGLMFERTKQVYADILREALGTGGARA